MGGGAVTSGLRTYIGNTRDVGRGGVEGEESVMDREERVERQGTSAQHFDRVSQCCQSEWALQSESALQSQWPQQLQWAKCQKTPPLPTADIRKCISHYPEEALS